MAIDQGTTNSKAVLVDADGGWSPVGSAPVGVTSPRPGWVEQDAERIWSSVLEAVADVLPRRPEAGIAGVALSTQRESVRRLAGRHRRAARVRSSAGRTAARRPGARSRRRDRRPRAGARAHRPAGRRDVLRARRCAGCWITCRPGCRSTTSALGTVDAWLIWRLTGGRMHACEAGNASRTLLYDVADLDWSADLLAVFGVPATALPEVRRLRRRLRHDPRTCRTYPTARRSSPCWPTRTPPCSATAAPTPGTAKATYGTGSSVMAPVEKRPPAESPVPDDPRLGDRRLAHLRPGRQHPLLRRHPGLDRRPAHRRQRRAT